MEKRLKGKLDFKTPTEGFITGEDGKEYVAILATELHKVEVGDVISFYPAISAIAPNMLLAVGLRKEIKNEKQKAL